MINEAEKYAQLLGYNYQSSKWYENSYSLFDKTYEKRKKERLKTYKKKGGGFIKKFKSLTCSTISIFRITSYFLLDFNFSGEEQI